jgi:ubiquinone/menaquinone biosynthesis C-methylase UbiE
MCAFMEKHEHSGKGSGSFIDVQKVITLLLEQDDVFLDIGCGPGDYLKMASKITKHVTGIDNHEESIEQVRRSGFHGILADVTKKIPLEDDSVDSVLMANVLHGFVTDKTEKKVMFEIKRILKKNGKLGIVEFKKDSKRGPLKDIKLSDNQLIDTLEKYGFSQSSYHDVGESNYFMIFKKD